MGSFPLDFHWADRRWTDLTTGTEVVCLSPNERFLVGDGYNFDRHSMPANVQQRMEALAAGSSLDPHSFWFKGDLQRTNGGEIIWKYELPKETMWDYDLYGNDPERFYAELPRCPGKAVKTTPLCKFRSLSRSHMLGHRLESNAHVTPDSRWAVFQSSSEDDWFEVWAARVMEERGEK